MNVFGIIWVASLLMALLGFFPISYTTIPMLAFILSYMNIIPGESESTPEHMTSMSQPNVSNMEPKVQTSNIEYIKNRDCASDNCFITQNSDLPQYLPFNINMGCKPYYLDGNSLDPLETNAYDEDLDKPIDIQSDHYKYLDIGKNSNKKIGNEAEMYMDLDNLFTKKNFERQFYIPNTDGPTNQVEFAKWCFSIQPTCKEDNSKCLRYEDLYWKDTL